MNDPITEAVKWMRYATRVLEYIDAHYPDVLQEAKDNVEDPR